MFPAKKTDKKWQDNANVHHCSQLITELKNRLGILGYR